MRHLHQIDVEVWPKENTTEYPIKSWCWNGYVVPRKGDYFEGHLVVSVHWSAPREPSMPLVTVMCVEKTLGA